jgi:hypothetical protein
MHVQSDSARHYCGAMNELQKEYFSEAHVEVQRAGNQKNLESSKASIG